jgi:hypothetical protein
LALITASARMLRRVCRATPRLWRKGRELDDRAYRPRHQSTSDEVGATCLSRLPDAPLRPGIFRFRGIKSPPSAEGPVNAEAKTDATDRPQYQRPG